MSAKARGASRGSSRDGSRAAGPKGSPGLAIGTVEPASAPAAPANTAAPAEPAQRPERTCGSCRACCTLPDIPELNKPINVTCKFASRDPSAHGCTRYETRPAVCRSYRCGWMDGLGGETDRPDRLGVMWQPIEIPVEVTTEGDAGGKRVVRQTVPGLAAVEVWAGALDQPRAAAMLRQYHNAKPGRIVVRRAGEAKFGAVELRIGGRPVGAAGRMVESKPGQRAAGPVPLGTKRAS